MVDQLPLVAAVLLLAAALVATQCLRRTVSPAPIAGERRRDLDLRREATVDLTSAVNHELRTPLCTIRGASEILLNDADAGGLTGDQRRLIESLDRNGRRLEAVVEELVMLLDVHTNAGATTAELSVSDVVLQAWAEHRHLLQVRRAKVRLTGHLQDLTVHGSSQQLQLAVSQVLSNAFTFSPDPATIDLTMEQAGSEVVIHIRDRGVGIAAHELPSVFDWFYRGSAARTLATPGVGLGLTIAKVIVEAHRGTISLTSQEHHGTTVTIALPLVRIPPERLSAPG